MATAMSRYRGQRPSWPACQATHSSHVWGMGPRWQEFLLPYLNLRMSAPVLKIFRASPEQALLAHCLDSCHPSKLAACCVWPVQICSLVAQLAPMPHQSTTTRPGTSTTICHSPVQPAPERRHYIWIFGDSPPINQCKAYCQAAVSDLPIYRRVSRMHQSINSDLPNKLQCTAIIMRIFNRSKGDCSAPWIRDFLTLLIHPLMKNKPWVTKLIS